MEFYGWVLLLILPYLLYLWMKERQEAVIGRAIRRVDAAHARVVRGNGLRDLPSRQKGGC